MTQVQFLLVNKIEVLMVSRISTVDVVKFGTNVVTGHEYYKGRIDKLYLTKEGDFKILSGSPDVEQEPGSLDNAMHLFTISLPLMYYQQKM